MSKCKHCQQGTVNQFCCMGCKVAYSVINSLDLNNYYKYCKEIYGSKPVKINEVENQLSYYEFVQKLAQGFYRINLLVEGIHCGSCVWLIENALRKESIVESAHVNLSTRRLVIKWKGKRKQIDDLVHKLFLLGYKLIPFTPELAEDEAKQKERDLLARVGVAGLVNISMMMIIYGVWAGNFDHSMGYYTRLITHIFASIIAIPAIFYCGLPFFRSAINALKAGRSNMDIPISIGVLGATFISIQETILGSAYTYYDAAIGLIFFLLIGRYLELKSRNRAREFAHNLILSMPKTITLDVEGKLILLPLSKAKVGDTAFVSVGDKISADGVIIEGETEIDNSLITGESIPVKARTGDKVSSGTLNVGAPIKFKISALSDDTILGEIIGLMEVAEQGRADYVKIADRLAQYITPVILLLTLITFLLWYFLWEASFNGALLNSIALMIITCPCALGLAVPIVQVVASSKLMSRGIIVKAANALEKIAAVDYIIFDKTGTLTVGKPKLNNLCEINDKEFTIAASLASFSKHILCKEIASSKIQFDEMPKEIKGKGVIAELNGEEVRLGSRKFCNVEEASKDNYLEVWYKHGNKKAIRLTFTDQPRSDAKAVISDLKKLGYPLEILSGDRDEVVSQIAEKIGISNYKSEMTPQQKYEYVKLLSKDGKKVLMVGDGLNDAAALKAAFVSISPTSSLEITQTNSDIVFQGEKLLPIIKTLKIGKFSNNIVKQNFLLALLYNVVTIPIAVMGYVNPIVAAISMSASSIMVVLNSLRVKHD